MRFRAPGVSFLLALLASFAMTAEAAPLATALPGPPSLAVRTGTQGLLKPVGDIGVPGHHELDRPTAGRQVRGQVLLPQKLRVGVGAHRPTPEHRGLWPDLRGHERSAKEMPQYNCRWPVWATVASVPDPRVPELACQRSIRPDFAVATELESSKYRSRANSARV